ncbi:flagellar hook assembly protein FlgD [Acuticoccus sp. M5D2P5]|uniref:flagellar hook assembly protein FlgD n=1 Tax=Acuticoccus kalidii TaxID=2910977 RepID=UPI001F36CD0C|nr:flagellar hook assembly protein FlgD [Acuticoccus kalidii]MCF3932489.1 flagellar hook assembly protein FlgD [Acuticoccus kalidii]
MTTVPPVGNNPQGQVGDVTMAQSAPTLDYDAFLRLLVTQMQNQDPLEPMSDTEYIAQLANFSNVEQNIITNDRLSAMMTANALGDAQAMIGRTIATASGESGVVAAVQITSDGAYATLESGESVRLGAGLTIF